MAKAPTSYGYPAVRDADGKVLNGITSDVLARWLPAVSAARFGVLGEEDWQVTAQPGLDRGIRINAGTGFGDGVLDEFSEYDTMSLPLVESGSQWFLIVLRRNWTSPATSNFRFIPGTSEKAIPTSGVSNAPGQESDQHVALVRVEAGQTVVREIVDLRAWAGDGGVEAANILGREQLARPGASVKIGTATHRYEYNPDNGGSFDWRVYPTVTVLFGGVASDHPYQIKDIATVDLDANGFGAVRFAIPFPRRIRGATLTQVYQPTLGTLSIRYSATESSAARVAFAVFDRNGTPQRNVKGVRLTYDAWGD